MFQYLSDITGLQLDQVRYISLFICSYPLAVIFYSLLKYGNSTSNSIRHVFVTSFGLLFCYLCFGIYQLGFLVAFTAVGYLILHSNPAKSVHLVSFYYAMVCIAAAHIYRLWTDYGGFHLDFTGPFMLLVQRVTYVGFSYHDGICKKDEQLKNDDQKKNKITQLPSVLEYFSYNLCFLTVLAGPTCTYKEYIEMVNGENFSHNKKPGVSSSPNPVWPVLRKFCVSIIFLAFYLGLKSTTNSQDIVTGESASFLEIFPHIVIYAFYIRCRYYFVYSMTESISNAAGLGFYYDEAGRPKWDLANTVDIKNFEMGVNCKEQSIAWNVCTQKWLRRSVYERNPFPMIPPVLSTFLVSAWWHGLYPGYYISFVFLGFTTYAARKARHLLWHRFQSPRPVKILYDISTIITTNFYKDFAQMAFIHTSFTVGLRIWKAYYFIPVIIVILLTLLPDKKHVKQTKANGSHSTDKKQL